MTKGTPSMGKRQKRSHVMCRRCGSVSYNFRKKRAFTADLVALGGFGSIASSIGTDFILEKGQG